MNEQTENTKTFRTKTGYVEITPDKIIITRSGLRGKLAQFIVGDSMVRIIILYTLIVLLLAYMSYDGLKNGEKFLGYYFGFLAAYLAYGTIQSINNSAAPIIERDKIKSIKLVRGWEGLTRNRLIILFENEKGKIKKRIIILPGVLQNGKSETFKALGIMVDEGLMRDE